MELDEIGSRLNAAAESGDYEAALDLAGQYRDRFDEIWAAMPESARRGSNLPERALALHQRAIGRMVETRAAKAAELRSVKLARPYGRRSQAEQSWQMTL